ncbi:hypothetical protein [Marinobacterium sedimentorum]|uniref:hypothetical protein n=1 Tax=Marinobacterium sedimentorum TaxID=2927804 RepID=UPI0020C6E88B|nr:hypothetical protein [Marinobacterium sedimentorum]MCP8686076.1 hypothetical protein [Marinobacterium sedimentorum]
MKKDMISIFKDGCLAVPLMRPSEYARHVGVTPAAVAGQMDRGELPVFTLTPPAPGKRPTRYINLVALYELCKDLADEGRVVA